MSRSFTYTLRRGGSLLKVLPARSATNLPPPIIWSPVTNPPVNSSGQLIANLPFRFTTEFFRLTSP